jgi:hypothetical protein
MAPTGKVRIAAALSAIALAGSIVACSSDDWDNCPDYQCGDGIYFAPYIIPAYGVYGHPGYHQQIIIQPGSPGYRTTYVGQPPNYVPPSGAKINPSTAKPPPSYKPPTGATLTVQKAPQKSGNVQPGSTGSKSGGSKQTVQKAPSGGSSRSGGSSGGGSRSSSGGKK